MSQVFLNMFNLQKCLCLLISRGKPSRRTAKWYTFKTTKWVAVVGKACVFDAISGMSACLTLLAACLRV